MLLMEERLVEWYSEEHRSVEKVFKTVGLNRCEHRG